MPLKRRSWLGYLLDQLAIHPRRDPLHFAGLTVESIPWSDAHAGSGYVELWHRPTQQDVPPRAHLLHFIGNASRAESEATYFAELLSPVPLHVWSMNYPGFGESTGPVGLRSMAPAGRACFDWITQRQATGEAEPVPILVGGNSIGTAVAIHLCSARAARGCVLRNPPPLPELIAGKHGWWNLWTFAHLVAACVPTDLDSVRQARLADVPAIFCMATRDDVVPHPFQQLIADAWAGPSTVLKHVGADHGHKDTAHERAELIAAVRGMLDGIEAAEAPLVHLGSGSR